MSHVVIVGAGLAGLSAAMLTRAAGHDVTLLEQEPVAGGRLGLLVEHGDAGSYRFGTGPSTFGMPALVRECFTALGTPIEDYLQLARVRPGLVAHFPDGSHLSLEDDPAVLGERVEELAGSADAEGIVRFVDDLTETVRRLRGAVDRPAADSPTGLARRAWRRVEVARTSPRIQDYVADPRLHTLYRWSPVPGRAIDSPLGVLGCYTDLVAPAWFPRGGMFRLPAAMAAAAAAAGVQQHYRTVVTGTRVSRRRVLTVLTTEGGIDCDTLILTTTRMASFALLGVQRRPRGPYAPSVWMMLAGGQLSGPAPIAHRSVVFGRDDPIEDLIAGRLPRDPTLQVALPALSDASLAPRSRTTASVVTSAPHLGPHSQASAARPGEGPLIATSQDWGRIGGHYRTHILKLLAVNGFVGFDNPDVEHVLTPVDWLARGLEYGTPFGMHQLSRSNQWGDNVVLAGAALGQGSDITQALLSGMQAADRVTGTPHLRTDWVADPQAD